MPVRAPESKPGRWYDLRFKFDPAAHQVAMPASDSIGGESVPDVTGEAPASEQIASVLPKSHEDILAGTFTPTPKPSPAEQAERALRRPKLLIYCPLSNRHFFLP